jgi:hypothetical protein
LIIAYLRRMIPLNLVGHHIEMSHLEIISLEVTPLERSLQRRHSGYHKD